MHHYSYSYTHYSYLHSDTSIHAYTSYIYTSSIPLIYIPYTYTSFIILILIFITHIFILINYSFIPHVSPNILLNILEHLHFIVQQFSYYTFTTKCHNEFCRQDCRKWWKLYSFNQLLITFNIRKNTLELFYRITTIFMDNDYNRVNLTSKLSKKINIFTWHV